MKIDITTITALNDIRERLEAITPEQIESFGRKLTPLEKGETSVGQLHLPGTQALFTLGRLLGAEKVTELTKSQLATDPENEAELESRAVFADELEDVIKELSWFQARCDLGFWKHVSVGIRKDWTIVTRPENSDNPLLASLMKSLGK